MLAHLPPGHAGGRKLPLGHGNRGYVVVSPLEAVSDSTGLVPRGAYFLNAERGKGQGGGEE